MGYNPRMLQGAVIPLPSIDHKKHPGLVTLKDAPDSSVLDYEHHSVVLNKGRRMAVYSACNIDGNSIPGEKIQRKGSFRDERRVEVNEQVGEYFYELCGDIIDKGHLTKYEDVMWGEGLSAEDYVNLGKSTNFYPNAVPQHRSMNRGMWSNLELYILDKEVDENDLKICMFTGPVLEKGDPWYIKDTSMGKVQVPLHFWKIVVYKKEGSLYALGFMMSHKTLLDSTGLFTGRMMQVMDKLSGDLYFMDYKHSIPYQVKVELIERLAGITLKANLPIKKPYRDDRPQETVFSEIDIKKGMPEAARHGRRMLSSYVFPNLVTS